MQHNINGVKAQRIPIGDTLKPLFNNIVAEQEFYIGMRAKSLTT